MGIELLRPGESVTAERFNALAVAINEYLHLTAAAPLQITRHAGGIHVSLARQPSLELVELDENVDIDDSDKTANLLDFDPDATSDPWTDTELDISLVTDPQQAPYLKGERHLCWFHPDAGKYLPVPGVQWHLAILDEDLTPSGSAEATVYRVNDSGAEEAVAGITVTVYGWWLADTIQAGKRVMAMQHLQSRRWYAVQLPSARPSIEFKLNAPLTTAQSSQDATVLAYWSGPNPDPDDEGVTVYNMATKVSGVYHWAGEIDAHGYAVWDDNLARFRIIDLECPS